MLQWLNEAPFLVTFVFFFFGAMMRANSTYWIGRGIAAGVKQSRFQRFLSGNLYLKAQELLARWGVLAVPLSFLTVGVQSAVNASAGIARMPLRRYIPAVIVGCLIWALIYTTVGMTVVYAWLALGWQWVLATALVAALGCWFYWRGQRARKLRSGLEEIE